MNRKVVISDSGVIFSLAIINELNLLNLLFDKVLIPKAVWIEITKNIDTVYYKQIYNFFKDKIIEIKGENNLGIIMDYGESESVILYKELNADFLLIDDKKARKIAESLNVNCIGTLGLLIYAKENKFINKLRPYFLEFISNKRFYGKEILNKILELQNEEKI
ncbi:MAG: DUF3368 domain-containing protein [Bacteroidales bacterium]|nr:DUF3368 domain-containing protein [Bacteroidales bacterium]